MRKAAGFIMIVLGAIVLGINVFLFSLFFWRIDLLGIFMFAWAILAFVGGIGCIMRRYWGLCLASGISAVVLAIIGWPLSVAWWGIPAIFFVVFGFPLLLAGGIASIVFISRRKKEWQEILD